MLNIALEIKPEIVSLVPEKPEELTTEGGLDVTSNKEHLASHIKSLQQAGIKVSIFVDPAHDQIETCQELGCDMIEINTGKYADLKPGREQQQALKDIISAAEFGYGLGLKIHAGHGLDYKNIHPVAAITEIEEFSIGFSIVARAAITGIEDAVREMADLVD
jgi:pyridoxine 5-phosphate synthase